MPRLTLSFDNGPEPGVTAEVLAVLHRHRVLATFFVLGHKLADPARWSIAEQAHAAGHWIGNHTYSHSIPLGMRAEPDAPEAEIGRTQALLDRLSHPLRLFRPIGGGNLDQRLLSPAALDYLVRGRYTCVLWNCIPRDWLEPERWPATAMADLERRAWTLMVLHDLPSGAMRHLDAFLAAARKAGVEIVRDFPPDCVPIVEGRVVRPMDAYVSAPT